MSMFLDGTSPDSKDDRSNSKSPAIAISRKRIAFAFIENSVPPLFVFH